MTLLSTLRRLIYRRTSARLAAVLVALTLVTVTMPRWETHAHAPEGSGHVFATLHAAHHHAEDAPIDAGAPALETTHAHQAAAFAVALPFIEPLEVALMPPAVWSGIHRGRTVDAPPGAPPHRPPIA